MNSAQRIRWVGGIFALALLAVLVHCWFVMVEQQDQWLQRSFDNRWAFRSIPPLRGAITDRLGRVLARDVPTFQVAVDYEQFRRMHPMGAAVHGAMHVAAHFPELQDVRFCYAPGPRGPLAACELVLAQPLEHLRPDAANREYARDLRFYATSLLAGCSGQSRRRVASLLTKALDRGADGTLGDCLPGFDAAMLAQGFERFVLQLESLDAVIDSGVGRGDIVSELDEQREAWLRRTGDAPTVRRLVVLAKRLPFTLAAALRTVEEDHPGLWLEPTVERERAPEPLSTLGVLLGRVGALERDDRREAAELVVQSTLEEDELSSLVPDDFAPGGITDSYRSRARQHLESVLRDKGRSGTGGIEQACDDTLSGRFGMRLVERDKRNREQVQWASMLVAPGEDVTLTVDLDLQEVLEREAERARIQWEGEAAQRGAPPGRIDVGFAMVDARSGDLLGLAGAPLQRDGTPRIPPVLSWHGAGDLGSLVKPFVMLEQLQAEETERPHLDHASFEPCKGLYKRLRGQPLRCDHAHGEQGKEPVHALADSCNTFFFQVAEGLGDAGLERALVRVGLHAPSDPLDPHLASWQPRPRGIPQGLWPAPGYARKAAYPQMRAIGYGVQANAVAVARAYAAIATGELHEVGFLREERRRSVPLDVDGWILDTVQQGLAACVDHGTAEEVEELRQFGAVGKTGTAEIGNDGDANNAWFAGYLPLRGSESVQIAFCAVVYGVPDRVHGADAGGRLVADVLLRMQRDPALRRRYLEAEAPR